MTIRLVPAAAPSAAPEGDQEATVDALVQAAFVVMGVLTRIAAEHELSLTQLRVFGILRDRRPRVVELADYLGLEKSTMSGLISRAEQRGLVQRRRSAEDARATEVALTPVGLELAERVHGEVCAELEPLTDGLGKADRATLTRLLMRSLTP